MINSKRLLIFFVLALIVTSIYFFAVEPYQIKQASKQFIEELDDSWKIRYGLEEILAIESVAVAAGIEEAEKNDEIRQSEWDEESLERYADGRLPFAIVYIPRFGEEYAVPVFQGVDKAILKKGIGHYQFTAMPGDQGNFALAAHKSLTGGFFYNIDRLEVGDYVMVETENYIYSYQIYSELEERTAQGVDEVYAVPHQAGELPDKARITLQACKNHDIRYLVHGELVEAAEKAVKIHE